ncbi:MAG TPA: xanthine dehydrogenase family protein molybdopterin-binding subunit, partial [Candidatus Polarisedimenticolia bacterium]|nr:xanthine dehydrogenase family protein molybdopterin-binding subunit [Candidatus Polarisedimenticolia bacterium]
AAAVPPTAAPAAAGATALAPNAFLQVAPDGAVTLWASRSEMGQGVRTALPMILAEELGADWNKIKVEQAWSDPRFGELDTGGSDSIRSMYEPLRKAGATARAMLTDVAARRLGVAAATLVTSQGQVIHAPTNRKVPFADLVAEAATLPAPAEPPLKDPKGFTIVGRAMKRTDSPAKVDGKATYGIDVVLPGMLYAAVVLPPTFGAVPDSYDESSVRKISGVKGVVRFRRGFAVLADSTWAAFKGRDALQARFREFDGRKESSVYIRQRCEAALTGEGGKVLRSDGDLAAAMTSASRRVEATYEIPFQAHAPMEPTNATAEVKDGRCTIWAPAQTPSWARQELQTLLGLPAEAIRINITFLGGGFGRRINPDFILDVAEIARAAGAPVKMTWSREQDLRYDFYRPYALHKMAAAIDPEGRTTAWRHRFASTSISLYYDPKTTQPESDELGGAADLPHAIPNVMVTYSPVDTPVPRGWWRSVDSSGNAFVVESFLDEIAAATGKDPLRFRQDLLREERIIKYPGPWVQETKRLKAVLDLAAQKTPWDAELKSGQGRGVAAHFSFRSYCAMVAEVESDGRSFVRVRRIVAAVDCGRVVNPGLVAAQMESAVVFALSAAMKGGITIADGRVVEGNFNTFEVLRIDEMPRVETHIVPSNAPPTGVGEPGVPVVAPAVFNAVYAATKRRIRRLPFTLSDFQSA